jgi:oxygen-independent coproporphyrinogen-3 oxidase
MSAQGFTLYVHVPYCRRICPYCDFNVHVRSRPPIDADVDAFLAEIRSWAADAPWQGRPVTTVHLGGGTPSLVPPPAVGRLVGGIAAICGLEDAAEITLEANPGTVGPRELAGYRDAGVNRLSLGVQSFAPGILRTLGRDHEPDEARRAVTDAARAGFENVSLDLIYAVPGQDLAGWRRDLDEAIGLGPAHVSTYALTWEPDTTFATWRARGRLAPVDDDIESAMAELALERLGSAGYERYEISSHARPGFASRHNVAYWDGSSYLGVGPGAHSFATTPFPGRRWANERHPETYRARVREHGRALASEEPLDVAQAATDFVITGLRRLIGVDAAAFATRFGAALDATYPHVQALARDGLVAFDGRRLRLTERGLLFADTVSATFV